MNGLKQFFRATNILVIEQKACKMSRGADLACKVYIGDLATDATEKEIEREFSYYGRCAYLYIYIYIYIYI